MDLDKRRLQYAMTCGLRSDSEKYDAAWLRAAGFTDDQNPGISTEGDLSIRLPSGNGDEENWLVVTEGGGVFLEARYTPQTGALAGIQSTGLLYLGDRPYKADLRWLCLGLGVPLTEEAWL